MFALLFQDLLLELEGSDSSYAAKKVKRSICVKIIRCPVILSNLGLKKLQLQVM